MAQPCVHHMLEGLKELLRRAARAETIDTPSEALQEKCRELQRTADRKQVEFDLQRIAWEKDFDDCAGHLRQAMASLRDYTAQQKIEKAKTLLAQNTMSISDISEYLGYNSQSYFCSVFRKMTGMTPSEYQLGHTPKEESE